MNEHHERGHGDGGHPCGGHTPVDWDALYAESDRIWSGNPNAALVTEAARLAPGTALDIGCGEGADAIWLAEQGWQVTAIDVSSVAVDRAQIHGQSVGVKVDWQVTSFTGMPRGDDRFDLVLAFYAALEKENGAALAGLLDTVAPGGTLLFVHHADVDRDRAQARGFNPDAFLNVDEVATAVAERSTVGWTLEVHETRDRDIAGGSGAHHTRDIVVRARRACVNLGS